MGGVREGQRLGGGYGGGQDEAAALDDAQLAAAIKASLQEQRATNLPTARDGVAAAAAAAAATSSSSGGGVASSVLLRQVTEAIKTNREHWWPFPKGEGHLGVKFTNTVAANCEALRKQIEQARAFTASQALHRLTDGMPNLTGPPNGPERPTLATKWKMQKSTQDVDSHVLGLKMWLAPRAQAELGIRRGEASQDKTGSPNAGASASEPIMLLDSDDDDVAAGNEDYGGDTEEDEPRVVEPPSSAGSTNKRTFEQVEGEADEAEKCRLARLRRFS